MDRQYEQIVGMFVRYLFILLLGLGNLYLFYLVLTPLTIFFVNFILSLSGESIVVGSTIHFKHVIFDIIPACVAGSAFYLMFILVFSTRKIELLKRFYVLLTSFVLLFIVNVVRLVFLISIVRLSYFEQIHWVLFNFVSVIFVVGIWVLIVYLYKLKSIPVYSDILYLWRLIALDSGKKPKRR